jgi:uncharacterized protein DUF4154
LNSKTNANAGQVTRRAHPRSFHPAPVSLQALRLVLLLALAFDLAASGIAWAQPGNDEDHMKAAFLYHFAQLVEWPSDAFDGSGSSLVLCTLEDDSLYDELENTIQGRQIGSRTLRIRHVHMSQATRGCNLLFISKSAGKGLVLGPLRNLPILTVGEADDFLSTGGMIRFRRAEDKMRFDINLGAADSSHLKISSRLLLVANAVTRGNGIGEGR